MVFRDLTRLDPKAADAVRQIGTNALPFLLPWLNYYSSERDIKINRLLKAARIPWTPGLDKELRAARAQIAFQILGPRAHAAIPELTRHMNQPRPFTSARRFILAFVSLGEAGVPPIVTLITNETGQRDLRLFALQSVALMGTNARAAMPALLQCLNDQDSHARGLAAGSLGQLRLDSGRVVPSLANALRDTEPDVRYSATFALGKFAAAARSATPALLELRTDPAAHVRLEATNSLRAVAPEILTNAPAR